MQGDWRVLLLLGTQIVTLAFYLGGIVMQVRISRETQDRMVKWVERLQEKQNEHGEQIQAIEAVCAERHGNIRSFPVST